MFICCTTSMSLRSSAQLTVGPDAEISANLHWTEDLMWNFFLSNTLKTVASLLNSEHASAYTIRYYALQGFHALPAHNCSSSIPKCQPWSFVICLPGFLCFNFRCCCFQTMQIHSETLWCEHFNVTENDVFLIKIYVSNKRFDCQDIWVQNWLTVWL